jgi:oligopeptide/dipeptide ABC transporter ATP-binding protein
LTNLIEIKNLFIEYKVEGAMQEKKTVHAVNDLSLEIKQGEILSIAGESGCGKSTLAKAILRLIDSKSGEILLREKEEAKCKMQNAKCHCEESCLQDDEAIQKVNILKLNKKELKEFRKNAQIIFQNPYSSLNPKMKIYDILKEPLIINEKSLTKVQRHERVIETIKQVGLDESVLSLYPHEFSGGQRQRIAIARSLILKPKFIVADEPVSALDVSIQAQIINLLNELKEKFNLTFLFISHDLSVIKYLSDRVAIMYLGEIVELGNSEEIFNTPKHPYTQALLSANPGNKDEKIILKGELPSPTNLPAGCKFHTRCPHVMDVCKTVVPSKTDFSDTHCAYCHLY